MKSYILLDDLCEIDYCLRFFVPALSGLYYAQLSMDVKLSVNFFPPSMTASVFGRW